MATGTVEERLAVLEDKMARLLDEKKEDQPPAPWWEQRFGAFADSEEYDEAARLGREYRESLRPKGDGNEGEAA